MTSPSPAATLLSQALSAMSEAEQIKLAKATTISPRVIRRAARGESISADHYLRLCAGIGLDPFVAGREFAPFVMRRFDRGMLARLLKWRRMDTRHQPIRAAAKEMGVSARALSFMEHGRVVGIEAVLSACRYVNTHPFCFTDNSFTGNVQCNTLKDNADPMRRAA